MHVTKRHTLVPNDLSSNGNSLFKMLYGFVLVTKFVENNADVKVAVPSCLRRMKIKLGKDL